MKRTVRDAETKEPVTARFVRGRVYEVELEASGPGLLENVLLTDRLPGGFEIESGRRGGDSECDRVEEKDDRVRAFRTAASRGPIRFRYRMRAVFPGAYAGGSASAEMLYAPGVVARTAASRVEIEP